MLGPLTTAAKMATGLSVTIAIPAAATPTATSEIVAMVKDLICVEKNLSVRENVGWL